MAIRLLNPRWLLLALPLIGAISGCCCQAFPLPAEQACPTDARRIYCGAGEEAVRRCPCGPDQEFYGHKPTNWRTWPEGWRYGQYPCSNGPCEPACAEPVNAAPAVAEPVELNPFRNSPEEELPPATPPAEPAHSDKSAIQAGATETTLVKANAPQPAASVGINANSPAARDEAPKHTPPALTPIKLAPVLTAPATQPSDEAAPAKSPPVPMAPTDPAPAETPPTVTKESKRSSITITLPKLIAAENVTQAANLTPATSSASAPQPVAALPAAANSARPKGIATKSKEESPFSHRIAEHLTHTLMN